MSDEALPIFCPSCSTTGTLAVGADRLLPSEGFGLDDGGAPVCVPCDAPAGVRLANLYRFSN